MGYCCEGGRGVIDGFVIVALVIKFCDTKEDAAFILFDELSMCKVGVACGNVRLGSFDEDRSPYCGYDSLREGAFQADVTCCFWHATVKQDEA